MKCPRCHHEKPTGMKFCGQCAAPLASTCPSCGAANPPENKFCGQCAAPLLTTPATKFAAPDSYTPKHLAEKILTSRAALLAIAATMYREMEMPYWLEQADSERKSA